MALFVILFNRKLSFQHYIHHYTNKALSIIKSMKMLGNLTRKLLLVYKCLLYRTCVLSIALYSFQLWYFKEVLLYKSLKELKKIQRRVALWIIEAFHTLLLWRVEVITEFISIHFHLNKMSVWHYLWIVMLLK